MGDSVLGYLPVESQFNSLHSVMRWEVDTKGTFTVQLPSRIRFEQKIYNWMNIIKSLICSKKKAN